MLSDVHEFRFQRAGVFTGFWTAAWVLITAYLLWPLYLAITGALPPWFAVIAVTGIVYMWYMRLAAVRTMIVAGDGRVDFIRVWGRRQVDALDLVSVRPWLDVSRTNFVLRHARGLELLLEDPTQVALAVRELMKLNPELEVRGLPPLPKGVVSG